MSQIDTHQATALDLHGVLIRWNDCGAVETMNGGMVAVMMRMDVGGDGDNHHDNNHKTNPKFISNGIAKMFLFSRLFSCPSSPIRCTI